MCQKMKFTRKLTVNFQGNILKYFKDGFIPSFFIVGFYFNFGVEFLDLWWGFSVKFKIFSVRWLKKGSCGDFLLI